jgi:hypothetical protein
MDKDGEAVFIELFQLFPREFTPWRLDFVCEWAIDRTVLLLRPFGNFPGILQLDGAHGQLTVLNILVRFGKRCDDMIHILTCANADGNLLPNLGQPWSINDCE